MTAEEPHPAQRPPHTRHRQQGEQIDGPERSEAQTDVAVLHALRQQAALDEEAHVQDRVGAEEDVHDAAEEAVVGVDAVGRQACDQRDGRGLAWRVERQQVL